MSKSLEKCLFFPFPVYWTSNRLKYHNILDEFENTNIIFHRDAPCGVDPRIPCMAYTQQFIQKPMKNIWFKAKQNSMQVCRYGIG